MSQRTLRKRAAPPENKSLQNGSPGSDAAALPKRGNNHTNKQAQQKPSPDTQGVQKSRRSPAGSTARATSSRAGAHGKAAKDKAESHGKELIDDRAAGNGEQQQQQTGGDGVQRPRKRMKAGPVPVPPAGGGSNLHGSPPDSQVRDSAAAGDAGADAKIEVGDPTARTALEVGLNYAGLVEEEAGLLPPGADEAAYVRVRNRVLCMWRRDVSRVLTEEEAVAGVGSAADAPYALAAHRFLSTLGFINFGVATAQLRRLVTAPEDAGSVVVVGAGCAGLAAARQLRAAGYRVVVVEGRERPGGRVWSERLECRGARAVADIGGSIITGIDGNPLAVLAKQMRLPLANIRSDTPLYYADGSEPDPVLDGAVEALHNDLLDECNALKAFYEDTGADVSLGASLEVLWDANKAQLPGMAAKGGGSRAAAAATAEAARRLRDWHVANLEFANSCQADTLSLCHWDQDDPHEFEGAHCFVPGCNGRWVRELCRGLPIFYGSPVREIRYCATGVEVQTDGQTDGQPQCFTADAVVVTVPLGVLKRPDGIWFNPPLPRSKLDVIKRVGFGCMNKVILLFPAAFWGDQQDLFGHVAEAGHERGEAFLFYSYAHISGGALLVALFSGKAAEELEQRPPAEAAQRVMRVLRAIYEARGVDVPAPLQVMVTRWGADPFACGSYSSLPVGTRGGADYEALAENLGGRVFFAGEATTRKYPATMHGAFISGLEVAANLDATLRRQRQQQRAAASSLKAAAAATSAGTAEPGAAETAVAKLENSAAVAGGGASIAAHNGTAHAPSGKQSAAAPAGVPAAPLSLLAVRATEEEVAAAAEALDCAEREADQLQCLFSDPQFLPDFSAAGMAAIHVPCATPPTGVAANGGSSAMQAASATPAAAVCDAAGGAAGAPLSLLRLDLAALQPRQQWSRRPGAERRFLVVPRAVAQALHEAPSKEARAAMLEALPEHALTGTRVLETAKLVAAVQEQRRKRCGHELGQGQQQRGQGDAAVNGGGGTRLSKDQQAPGAPRVAGAVPKRAFLIPQRR